MSGFSAPPGISQTDLNAAAASNLVAMQALLPAAAATPPPGVGASSIVGSSSAFARADHTHTTSVQRKTLSTSVSGGVSSATWTFSTAYAVLPVVTATAQVASTATQPYVVVISALSLASVTFQVWQTQPPVLGGNVLNVANITVSSPVVAAPANVTLHCWAALPT